MTIYLLGSTAMIPLTGKLSDQFGRKPFLLVGALLFLLGSACAGLAQEMNQLIAFRLLQGVGAGIGISLVFTVLGDLFAPKERIGGKGSLQESMGSPISLALPWEGG